MNLKEKNTLNFKRAYQRLKNKSDMRFSFHVYHHDFNGEPFFRAESNVERMILDYAEEHGLIITILTPEASRSFSEKNWLVHVDENYVSFGSRNDDETHCIIEFC